MSHAELLLVVLIGISSLEEHFDGTIVLLGILQSGAIVGVVEARDLGAVGTVEQGVGILQSLVGALHIGEVIEGQTVPSSLACIASQTILGELKALLAILMHPGSHCKVGDVNIFELGLVNLVVVGDGLVETVGVVVDAACKGINGEVGTMSAQLFEVGNSLLRATTTQDVSILEVSLGILRIEILGLLIHLGSLTAVVLSHSYVAHEDVSLGVLLVACGCHLCILESSDGILCIQECLADGYEHLRVLLVHLLEALHLLIDIHLRSNNVLHLAEDGLVYLCHYGSAEAEHQGSNY